MCLFHEGTRLVTRRAVRTQRTTTQVRYRPSLLQAAAAACMFVFLFGCAESSLFCASTERSSYKPPLSFHVLTPLYDFIVAITCREATFRPVLIQQANVAPGDVVLDLGCGTGSLTAALKRTHPFAELTCIDPDPASLARAARKVGATPCSQGACDEKGVQFVRGFGQDMSFANQTFDRVLSSLVLHHLLPEDKLATLREIERVLRPSGQLHVADWGEAHVWYERALFLTVQLLDGFDTTSDSVQGILPTLMRTAGFVDVQETRRILTPLGILSLYSATKPS